MTCFQRFETSVQRLHLVASNEHSIIESDERIHSWECIWVRVFMAREIAWYRRDLSKRLGEFYSCC